MKKLFIVDCVSQFRITYIVETENAEWAKDSVTCNADGDEIDQEWLGETIISSREINKDELSLLRKTAVNGHVLDELILKDDEK